MPSVFWSWQSDAPNRETRAIIKEALEAAVSRLNSSIEEAARPSSGLSIDHDTKDLPGSPDIVASILMKIDEASAFVADVTPIGVIRFAEKTRHVANPNVLIELGYAKKTLGLDRVIQVWNTAITDCTVDDLPFDMRGRRGPISFHLAAGSSTDDYRACREKLTNSLVSALAVIKPKVTPENPWPKWQPPNPNNPAIWFDEGAVFTVNESHRGSGKKSFPTAPTQYVRLLPIEWDKPTDPPHSCILGHTLGISWGRTTGGYLTYSGATSVEQESPHGTILFKETGEVWAIDRWVVAEFRGKKMFHGDEMFGGLVSFLSAQVDRLAQTGGHFPFKAKIGVTGLLNSHWPLPNPLFGDPAALENEVEIERTLEDSSEAQIRSLVVDYWTAVRDAFGLNPPDEGRIAKAMQYFQK